MRFTALLFTACLPLNALTIQIDYSLDSNSFFSASGNPGGATGATKARSALEAAAARWSAIINQTLQPVFVNDHPTADIRLSFPDPSNFTAGVENPTAIFEVYEASSAASAGTDSLVSPGSRPPANQYRNGISIPADTFVIYVGGRGLLDDALTAGLIGYNYDAVINDPDSFLNRGFNNGNLSLPTWGSSISFNSNENSDADPDTLERKWHFDHTTEVPEDTKDFYSVALAEIGHALGVGLFYNDWTKSIVNSEYRGPFTLAMYQSENGGAIDSLELQGPQKRYFARGLYTSKIFSGGNPNYVGTVGPDAQQPLLFQARPTAPPLSSPDLLDFVPGIIHGQRFEITNLDVAAINDIGWSLIVRPPENEVSYVTLTRGPGATVTLTFPSEVDASYTIQTSTNMVDWMNVTPAFPSEGTTSDWNDGEAGFSDPLGSAFARSEKYYRVLKNN